MPKMCILRAGNGFMFELKVSLYYSCQIQVYEVHKSDVKENQGPNFVENAYF